MHKPNVSTLSAKTIAIPECTPPNTGVYKLLTVTISLKVSDSLKAMLVTIMSVRSRLYSPSPECMQDGEVDGFKDWVRCIEVVEQHDEESVVGQLVELGRSRLLVLEEHVRHRHQHLQPNE